MCGRYALYGPTSRIREQFDLDDGFDFGQQCSFTLTTRLQRHQTGSDRLRLVAQETSAAFSPLGTSGTGPVGASWTAGTRRSCNCSQDMLTESPDFDTLVAPVTETWAPRSKRSGAVTTCIERSECASVTDPQRLERGRSWSMEPCDLDPCGHRKTCVPSAPRHAIGRLDRA